MSTVDHIFYIILIVACTIGIYLYRRQFSFPYQYLIAYLGLWLLAEVAHQIVFLFEGNSRPVIHVYHILEFAILSALYHRVLKFKRTKRLLGVLIPIYLLLMISCSLWEGFSNNCVAGMALGHSALIVIGLLYVYESYHPPFDETKLLRNHFFWFNTAHLFFFSGMFFYYGFIFRMFEQGILEEYSSISLILNFSFLILYLFGILCQRIFK